MCKTELYDLGFGLSALRNGAFLMMFLYWCSGFYRSDDNCSIYSLPKPWGEIAGPAQTATGPCPQYLTVINLSTLKPRRIHSCLHHSLQPYMSKDTHRYQKTHTFLSLLLIKNK